MKKVLYLISPFFRIQASTQAIISGMKAYIQHLFQWVWSTNMHHPTLRAEGQEQLFAYIAGLLRKKSCFVYAVNGTNDHIHVVTSLHPSQNISSIIKDIKLSTTDYIRRTGMMPDFDGWQMGYGSFTYSGSALKNLTRYVVTQKEHHRIKTFTEEFMDLLKEHGVDYDERYLW
ncbi:MAG TPA: transposase [Bacteroidales bacterium]|nr:transposase [Bacteroidales bacterium]